MTSIMIAYSSLLLFVECLAEEMNCEFEESWSRKCHMSTRACHEDIPVVCAQSSQLAFFTESDDTQRIPYDQSVK